MSRLARALALLLAITGLGVWSGEALAIAKFARITGNWGTAGTWSNVSCAAAGATTVPTAADAVTICPGVTVTVNVNAVALSVDVQATGVLTQSNRSLTISGPLNVAGTHTCGNTLAVSGATTVSGALNITATNGTKTFTGDVTINGGGAWNETAAEAIAFGGSLQNDGTLTASTGVHTFSGAAKTFSGSKPIAIPSVAVTGSYTNTTTLTVATALSGAGTLTNGANATLNIGNTATVTTLNASASPNTVNYYRAGNQTLKQATYHHLTLSGSGTKSSGAITLQVNGTTTVTGTATFNISSTTGTKTFVGPVVVDPNCSWTNTANEPVTFRGGITHNGTTFSSGTGLQTFDTNSQVLAGASAMTFGGAVTVTGAISLTNSNSNTVTINGTLNGTVAGSSTFVNGANATLNYGAAAAPMATGVSGSGIKTMPAGAMTMGGDFAMSGAASTTAADAMTVNGNFTIGAGTTFNAGLLFAHGIKGNFSNSGTFTASTSTVTLNGATAQTIGGTVATTFYGLTVDNAAGVSLSGVNVTASSLLTLQSGAVATGAQILVASANCPGGIARVSGHVAGNLQLRFPTGTPSCTFHVGDASAYRPVAMVFASVTTAGNLTGTVSQAAGEHPNIATSGLDSAKDVNRYWTLSKPAAGAVAFTTYTATFNFINPGDFDSGATPASFEIERWDGAAWNTTTLGSAGATSTSASGLPSFAAGSSNSFAVGQKKGPSVGSITLASTDPTSPATSVSWTVTFSESVTGVNTADFALVMGGGATGATITGVSGSGTTWTVTANTGTAAGTLGLNLVDDDSIMNAALIPLGGAGTGNGNFTGAVYTILAAVAGAFNACDVGTTCTNTTPSTYIKTKIAGSAFSLDLVALKADGTRNTSYNNNVLVELLDSSNNSGVLDADKCRPTWSVIATLSPNPAFAPADNGLKTVGTFTVANAYPNVRVRVTNVGGPSRRGCSTDNFAIRPNTFASFAVSDNGTWDTAGTSRALTNVTLGSVVHKAGRYISVRANAMNAAGSPAITTNYVGAPTATTTACVGAACTATFGTLTLNTTFVAGQLASDVASYDNVGAFALELVDSTFSTVDDSDGSTAVQREIRSGVINVGRFVPDHLAVTYNTPAFDAGCSGGFTYIGQRFSYATAPVITVTAQNFANATTTLYTGSWWRITDASLTGKSYTSASGTLDTSGVTGTDPTIGDSGGGIGTLTFGSGTGLLFTRAAPVVPFDADIALAINVIDADGVTFASNPAAFGAATIGNGIAFNNGKPMRYGRLRLLNAYGSELLPLRVPVQAEFFSGTTWTLNTADSCTSLPATAFALSGGISANTSASAVALNSGIGTLTLAKPSPVTVGSVDVAANLGVSGSDQSCLGSHGGIAASMPWLRGFWAPAANCNSTAAWAQDPNARVKFGSPKAPYIYLRERY